MKSAAVELFLLYCAHAHAFTFETRSANGKCTIFAPYHSYFLSGNLSISRSNASERLNSGLNMSDSALSSVGVVINTTDNKWKRSNANGSLGRSGENALVASQEASIRASYTFQVSIRKPLGLELMEEETEGVLVSNVWAGSNAEKAGILKGDRIMATSATLGGGMWEKTTIDGVISAITSRLIIADDVIIQLERDCVGSTFSTEGSIKHEDKKPEHTEGRVLVVAPLDTRAKRTVSMLYRFGDMGSLDKFPIVWNAVRSSGRLESEVYHAAMQAALKLGSPDSAVQVFRDMQKAGVPPGLAAYTTLIKAHGKAQNSGLQDAFNALIEADSLGYKPDVVAYNALLGACARKGDLEAAEKLFWGDMQGKLTVADAFSWNTLLNAYARAGMADKAQALLESMKLNGVVADKVTYTTLMKCFIGKGQIDEATALLQFFWKQNEEESCEGETGPDVRAYNTLIEGRLKTLDIPNAESLFEAMKLAGNIPDLMTYSLMMDGFLRAEMPEKALEMFDTMKANLTAPNLQVYTTAIAAAANCGDMFRALGLLQEMERCGIRPNQRTFTAAMQACVNGGQAQTARTLYEQMLINGIIPDKIAKATLIRAFCASRDLSGAIAALHHMEEGNRALSSPRERAQLGNQPLTETEYDNLLPTQASIGNECEFNADLEVKSKQPSDSRGLRYRAPLPAYNAIMESASLSDDFKTAISILQRAILLGYSASEVTVRCLTASTFRAFQQKKNMRRSYNSVALKSQAERRVEYLLQVSDLLQSKRGVHGVVYQALLMDCLAAERIDIAKDVMNSRREGYFVVGRSTKSLAEMLEDQVKQWNQRHITEKGLPGSMQAKISWEKRRKQFTTLSDTEENQ